MICNNAIITVMITMHGDNDDNVCLIMIMIVLMIYEINYIWTAEMKWKWRNDRRGERNLCNCVKKPKKKIRTSTGFEPLTSRLPVRCSTNWHRVLIDVNFVFFGSPKYWYSVFVFTAINTKISLYLWSYPLREWNRISSLPVILVKCSKYFA